MGLAPMGEDLIPQIEDAEAQRDETEEADSDAVDYQRITDLIEENREAEEADAENAEDPEDILGRLEEGDTSSPGVRGEEYDPNAGGDTSTPGVRGGGDIGGGGDGGTAGTGRD